MNIIRLLLLSCCLIVTACGGGGSGSGGGSTGESDEVGGGSGGGSGDDDDSDGDGPGDGGGNTPPVNQVGSATIVFPSNSTSSAITGTVLIKGTAEDADGVASVTVNGQLATIDTGSSPSPINSSSYQSNNKVTISAQNQVTWSASVDLTAGNNNIEVSVQDDNGNIESGTDSKSVSYLQVPINFHLDTLSNRVVGSLRDPFSGSGLMLVDYDYVNDAQVIYTEYLNSHTASCFKSDTSDFIYLQSLADNEIRLNSYNLTTGNINLLANHTFDPESQGFVDRVSFGNMVCDASHANAYLLVNYIEDNGGNTQVAKSTVFSFDLSSGSVDVLTETDPNQNPIWLGFELALTQDAIVSRGRFGVPAPLTSIDLSNGSRTTLANSVNIEKGLALAPDLANNIVYVVELDGVYALNLNTEEYTNISVVDDLDPFVFTQIQNAEYDSANNRVVVSDSDLDMLLAIDVNTGQRTDFLSRRVGTGIRIIAPRQMALTADNTKLYVGDDGGNGPERLFEIDLATGDRTEIGTINRPFNVFLWGLALDEANQKVYVAFTNSVIEVDLMTETTTVIADSLEGSGVPLGGISDILLDIDNNRLLIADAGQESIIALNLEDGVRTTFSADGIQGDGDPFAIINSMTFNADKSLIYVTNQLTENIMSVDISNGDRQIVLDECRDEFGQDVLGNQEALRQVLYKPSDNSLYIHDDNLLSFEIESGECTIIQFSSFGILSFGLTNDDKLLAIAFKSMGEYDPELNEFVIISK